MTGTPDASASPPVVIDERDRALRVAYRALLSVAGSGSFNMVEIASALGTVAEALKVEIQWTK